jgi:hypothetical protein
MRLRFALVEVEWRKMAGMDVKRSGSEPSEKGPEHCFTGSVRIDARFSGSAA